MEHKTGFKTANLGALLRQARSCPHIQAVPTLPAAGTRLDFRESGSGLLGPITRYIVAELELLMDEAKVALVLSEVEAQVLQEQDGRRFGISPGRVGAQACGGNRKWVGDKSSVSGNHRQEIEHEPAPDGGV
jgi:hypothetical protein